MIQPDGEEWWQQEGKYHRKRGPSHIKPNGNEYWHQNGLLHREDGPAIIYPGQKPLWWLNGKQLSRQEHFEQTSEWAKKKLIFKFHEWK